MIKQISAKARNLFGTGKLVRRYDGGVQVETLAGRVLEKKEAFPYGFYAKAKSGKVFVLCPGGDFNGFEILPVLKDAAIEPPELEENDAALYTANGGRIVCREDGTVELYGKDLGGIIKVDALKQELEKINSALNMMLSVIRGAPVPEAGSGAPSAFQAALTTALASAQTGDFSDIASDKVFHGTGGAR
jgi:phage gp45-like